MNKRTKTFPAISRRRLNICIATYPIYRGFHNRTLIPHGDGINKLYATIKYKAMGRTQKKDADLWGEPVGRTRNTHNKLAARALDLLLHT